MMTSRIKVLLVIVSVVGLVSCENDIEKVQMLTDGETLPAQTVHKVEFTYSDSARIKFRIVAPKLDRYIGEDPYDEFTEGVKVISYNEKKEIESQITANYAINRTADKVMEAMNDVVVINNEGKMLNTEHLIWSEKDAKIYTDKFVKITTPEEIIFGDGLEANQDFSSYTIKNIKGRIKVQDESLDE